MPTTIVTKNLDYSSNIDEASPTSTGSGDLNVNNSNEERRLQTASADVVSGFDPAGYESIKFDLLMNTSAAGAAGTFAFVVSWVTTAWDSTVTWNTKPSTADSKTVIDIVDFETIGYPGSAGFAGMDNIIVPITARTGTVYGVEFKITGWTESGDIDVEDLQNIRLLQTPLV
tara:strand:+ start:51 stop:566 length:516 start_codon:yes stop_codon:yes gene_type:complete